MGDPQVNVWVPGESPASLPAVDAVLALWGVARGDDTALAANTHLALAAQQLAVDLGASRVIHCSSSAVYAPSGEPQSECAVPVPAGPYGRAKLAMEHALGQAAVPGPPPTMLRIGNVAGADSLFANMRPGGVIALDRFPDGRGPRRSYLGPSDLARILATLIDAPDGQGVFNVAAPKAIEMQALAEAAGCRIEWQPAPPGAIPALVLDTARISALCALPSRSSDPRWLIEDARTGAVWP